jgi:hypothetical protein
MAFTESSIGLWLIDLSATVGDGVLSVGESTTASTVTLRTAHELRADAGHGVFAVPYPNTPPVIDSAPVTAATAGTAYSYQVLAHDPDGAGLTYVLFDAPQGMALDADTGLLAWNPTAQSAAQASVVLRACRRRTVPGSRSRSLKLNSTSPRNTTRRTRKALREWRSSCRLHCSRPECVSSTRPDWARYLPAIPLPLMTSFRTSTPRLW